jgi:hypothetical protein
MARDPWPYWSYMLSLFSIHTSMRDLILLPKPHTLGIWVHTWLVKLSHAVMSIVQVIPSYWCWVWLVLLLRVLVFHPLWCEVTVLGVDVVIWAWVGLVEMVGFCQVMWVIMLKSAKDQVLGVDTPGKQVLPRVRFGTACLLIRNVVGCDSCSAVLGKTQDVIWSTRCKRGSSHEETLALLVGPKVMENHSKAWLTPIVDLCNGTQWSLGHTPKDV